MKVSIITVAYNSAETIRDTIESVLSQTYGDIEYIVVDGQSQDGTLDIIREYESAGKGNLIFISEPDNGIYDAMNKGIRLATGDVVGTLNSDDFFTSDDVISQVVQAFGQDESLQAVYGDVHYVKADNLNKCIRYYSSRFFRRGLLRFGYVPAHPSLYCKKEVFEKYGLYDLQYKTSSDFDMMLRLFGVHRIKAKYIGVDCVTMRVGGETSSGVSSIRRINRDLTRSLKSHGIYSNQFFHFVRYMWKVCELIYSKFRYF